MKRCSVQWSGREDGFSSVVFVMEPGGKGLIVDAVIPPCNRTHFGKLLDLEVPVLTPRSRECTQAEFRELLKRSGSRVRRVASTELTSRSSRA